MVFTTYTKLTNNKTKLRSNLCLNQARSKNMDTAYLTNIVAVLIILSIASERLVEIVKSLIPYLDNAKPNKLEESRRRALLHVLAIIAGIFTAFICKDILSSYFPDQWDTSYGVLAFGLMASGGSSFWNSILGYLSQVKKIKSNEASK